MSDTCGSPGHSPSVGGFGWGGGTAEYHIFNTSTWISDSNPVWRSRCVLQELTEETEEKLHARACVCVVEGQQKKQHKLENIHMWLSTPPPRQSWTASPPSCFQVKHQQKEDMSTTRESEKNETIEGGTATLGWLPGWGSFFIPHPLLHLTRIVISSPLVYLAPLLLLTVSRDKTHPW